MRIDQQKLEEKFSRHPGEETLDDYYHGRLNDIDHLTIQCHLVDCEECVRIFRDVIDFASSARTSNAAMSKKESGRVWENIRDAVRSDDLTQVLPPDDKSKIVPARWVVFTIAAAALLLLVTVGAWVIKLRRDNKELAAQAGTLTAQLEQSQKDWQNRVDELAKQPGQESQAQETARDDKQKAKPAPLSLNVPVYNVYSTDWVKRSGEQNDLNRIKLLPRDESVVMILVGDSQQGPSEYVIEIVSRDGRSLLQNRRLHKNSYGNFVILLRREFLLPGTYRIRVRGQAGNTIAQITEYLIKVE